NGIRTDKTFSCIIYVNSDLFTNGSGAIDLTTSTKILSFNKKKRETTIVCCNWIEEKTFENRLKLYLDEIVSKGYFAYTNNIKIYNNGDLHLDNEFKINL